MARILIAIAVVIAALVVMRLANRPAAGPPLVLDAAKRTALAADLVDAGGAAAPADALAGGKPTLVYFSASWCPPCRAFTPGLVEYYNKRGGGEDFDLLFVSRDSDAGAALEYMRSYGMPWWGVRHGSASAQALERSYAGPGIPCLVLLDAQGKVLAHSYEGREYRGPHQALVALDALLARAP